jgi:ABC-type transport system involved in multi-copper enzyme maturation permease subunit
MTQIAAIFLDAYRELNARRMFWITMILSGLVLTVVLMISIGEGHKFKIAFWTTPFPVPPMITLTELLKGAFVIFGIGIWLTWVAAILALISTASIFPDFVSSGSIDMVLAKPLGRIRLFVLKYLSGLLFVALQVTVFSTVGFVIIGMRTGTWEVGLFLAVPLVVAFFSYLFCVCAFVGVITRSTIASLLSVLLFWFVVFLANAADEAIMLPRILHELYVEKIDQRLAQARETTPANPERVLEIEAQLDDARADLASLVKWHRLALGIKTVLPKTAETVKLLERTLIDIADLPDVEEDDQPMPFLSPQMRAAGVTGNEALKRIEQDYRHRSTWWILGTSLGFELVVLCAAAWIFQRRDF